MINVNFIKGAGQARRLVIYFLSAAVFLSAAAVAGMIAYAPAVKGRIVPLEEELKAAVKINDSMDKPGSRPSESEIAGLIAKITTLNRLGMPSTGGAVHILSSLEKATPDGIYAEAVYFSPAENTLRVSAYSKSKSAPSDYMKNLEKSGVFTGAVLEKQGITADGSVEFTVRLSEVKK